MKPCDNDLTAMSIGEFATGVSVGSEKLTGLWLHLPWTAHQINFDLLPLKFFPLLPTGVGLLWTLVIIK